MGVSKSQTSKTQTSDPLGVSKTQTLQVSRKLSPLRYKKFRQRVPNNAASRLVYCSSITESAEKRKRLAVEETYTDHENNIQRVSESTGAKFSCVTVSQPANVCPASDTGYSLQVYPYGSLWFDALSWFEFLGSNDCYMENFPCFPPKKAFYISYLIINFLWPVFAPNFNRAVGQSVEVRGSQGSEFSRHPEGLSL